MSSFERVIAKGRSRNHIWLVVGVCVFALFDVLLCFSVKRVVHVFQGCTPVASLAQLPFVSILLILAPFIGAVLSIGIVRHLNRYLIFERIGAKTMLAVRLFAMVGANCIICAFLIVYILTHGTETWLFDAGRPLIYTVFTGITLAVAASYIVNLRRHDRTGLLPVYTSALSIDRSHGIYKNGSYITHKRRRRMHR